MDKAIKVEVLDPPMFTRTGKVVDRVEAWKKGYWYGQFNIWIVKRRPEPSIVFQKRSPTIGWAPNKLDVPVGGHYENGEDFKQAVKTEAKEELGVEFKTKDFIYFGRKLAVNKGAFDNTNRNVVIDIYLLEDERPISSYKVLDKQEIYGLCEISVENLLNLFEGKLKEIKTKLTERKKQLEEEHKLPSWIERKAAVGKISGLPKREDIVEPISEQDIVEFYSR